MFLLKYKTTSTRKNMFKQIISTPEKYRQVSHNLCYTNLCQPRSLDKVVQFSQCCIPEFFSFIVQIYQYNFCLHFFLRFLPWEGLKICKEVLLLRLKQSPVHIKSKVLSMIRISRVNFVKAIQPERLVPKAANVNPRHLRCAQHLF